MSILATVAGILLALNVLGFALNKMLFSGELVGMKPYGRLANVHGQKMHIYSLGDGEETIVLLPGLGVPLPSADFGPLMRELSRKYSVVSIEYFGTGFSDRTEIPRTNENYTGEIREVLSSAGFFPPYILMPHSASGIYSEYYATKYSEEVSAIIMLDTTSSAEKGAEVPRFLYQLGRLQQANGFGRILNSIIAPRLLKEENGYTRQEIRDYRKFLNHALNDTIIDQNIRFNDNILEVMGMEFPEGIPVLKIVPEGTVRQVGKKYQEDHMKRLGKSSGYRIVAGSHFLYQTDSVVIHEMTTDFLNKH